MNFNRRNLLALGAATITVLPFNLHAATDADTYETDAGAVTVHPVNHASFVLDTPMGTIYVDPVGDAAAYSKFDPPALVLITHEHGDHYNAETLASLMQKDTVLITNPAVNDMLPDTLKAQSQALANDENTEFSEIKINAIPAYNLTEERKNFHPKGRDNGYVLTIGGKRIYISGDTEDIPEMRALKDIDVAFVCMNLPFTMDTQAAADAVAEFAPRIVYPYHYRGKDGGTQDPENFAAALDQAITVRLHNWYG